MREAFVSLPRARATDPTGISEYQRAVVFQTLTLNLSLKMVDTIRRYARLYDLQIGSGPARVDRGSD